MWVKHKEDPIIWTLTDPFTFAVRIMVLYMCIFIYCFEIERKIRLN